MKKMNEEFKAERIRSGLTQEDVAKPLGIPVKQLDDFEEGRSDTFMSRDDIFNFLEKIGCMG